MEGVTFVDVTPEPEWRSWHYVVLDLGGKVYGTCSGVTRECEMWSSCGCDSVDAEMESDDPRDEFEAHGNLHRYDDRPEDYVTADGKCYLVHVLSDAEDPDYRDALVTEFIAEVQGIPGMYPAQAYDGPPFFLDWSTETHRDCGGACGRCDLCKIRARMRAEQEAR